jgi:signal-transduction protein with cAMP-binding, CBS, and nucleotidyltransferase domain
MTKDVPRVRRSATVLEAAETMNRANSTGVAVLDEKDNVVGIITALRLLREFFALNKRPEDVKAGQVMGPFYRISPNASTKEAARKILADGITRLGVFDGDEFLGWISVTDLMREFGKRRLTKVLRTRDDPEDQEFLCPNCHGAFMEKVTNGEGEILRWRCPNCDYFL